VQGRCRADVVTVGGLVPTFFQISKRDGQWDCTRLLHVSGCMMLRTGLCIGGGIPGDLPAVYLRA
jgi:hypothetical protein